MATSACEKESSQPRGRERAVKSLNQMRGVTVYGYLRARVSLWPDIGASCRNGRAASLL